MEIVESGSATRPENKRSSSKASKKGLALSRRFTRAGVDPFSLVEWESRRSVISNPDGSVVFVVASGARLRFAREADGTWAFSGLRADLARRKEHAANALAIMQRNADEYRRGGTTRRDR